jgi:hypothetical protein
MPVPQDQGDQLELPRAQTQDGAQGADSPGAADRPARGSTADLRQRLERLPQGHPSSPYHDDGTSKPPLARLKNLELPLPGEEREPNGGARRDASGAQLTPRTGDRAAVADAAAGVASYPDPDVQDRQPVVREPDPAGPSREPERHEPADPETAGNEPTGWDHLSARETDRPTARDRPPAQETTWGHAPESQDQPDARETAWDRPAAQETSWGQSLEPRDQPDARETVWGQSPEPQDRPDGREHEPEAHDEELVPRREDDLDDDEPATQDQPAILDDQVPAPAEQADSRRRENLTPEQVRLAVRTLGQCRLAEGRSVFGSYGDTGLTPAMRRIEDQLEHGELVPETEKYALKSLDRFQEKLAKQIERHPDKSPEELAHEIHDGVRYTFIFDEDNYYDGTWEVHSKLEEHEFDLEFRRNTWTKPDYKGINSRWHDPTHDVVFEVQFHTMASWDAKQRTHDDYEKISDVTIPRAERKRVEAAQKEVSATVPLPPRCTEIPDYRKEG